MKKEISVESQRKLGSILSYVSIIVNTLIQLLYTPFLIRMLGQSEYGLYSLVNTVIGYFVVLDLGFGNAITVYTAKYRTLGQKDKEQKLHGMFRVVFAIISVLAMMLGLILYFNVNNIFGNTLSSEDLNTARVMMLILTLNLGISFYFSIYTSIISAYERFTFQKITAIASAILKPLIMIPILLLGYKSIAIAIVLTVVNAVFAVVNYLFCRKNLTGKIKFRGFDKALFKTIFIYSFWIFLAIIVDKVNSSADQFILGAVSGTIAVSIYSIAASIYLMLINISTAISNVLLPKMSALVAKKTSASILSEEFIKIGRIQYFIMFFACSCIVLFGRTFIHIWVGEGFDEAYFVTLLLTIPACIPLIQNLGISIVQAMNKHRFRAIITFVMAILNIIISIFLAKQFGAIGAAIGTTIALVLCNGIIMNIYYAKVIKLHILRFWKNIAMISVFLLIPVLAILLFMAIIPLDGLISIIVYGIIYFVLYAVVSYIFAMNNYERNLIKHAARKIRRIKK